jgi:DNA-binding NarL/FixJ family response regulator
VADAIRVLLVDDDPLVRAGLRLMLGGTSDITIVGEAADGDEVLAAAEREAPDVILLDIRMPRLDGIAALHRLRAARPTGSPAPPPAVIVLTTFRTDAVVLEALRAGAAGFLLKHTPPVEIMAAIRAAARGEPTVSPAVLRQLIDHVAAGSPAASPPSSAFGRLSGREREVALAVAEGLSNAEIAERLFLSVSSVKAHISTALDKLGVDNRIQLAIIAHDAS